MRNDLSECAAHKTGAKIKSLKSNLKIKIPIQQFVFTKVHNNLKHNNQNFYFIWEIMYYTTVHFYVLKKISMQI